MRAVGARARADGARRRRDRSPRRHPRSGRRPAFLRERDEERAGDLLDDGVRSQRVNARVYRRAAATVASVASTTIVPVDARRHRGGRARLDDAQHGERPQVLAQRLERDRRRRVARDDQQLDAARDEEIRRLHARSARPIRGSSCRRARARCRRDRAPTRRAARARIARSTVSPPTPESKTPIGRSGEARAACAHRWQRGQ